MLTVPQLNLGAIDAVNFSQRREKEFLARIFFRDSFLEAILDSKKYFLIGEKGAGKTAYATLLNNSEYQNTMASVRSLTATDYTKFIKLKENGHLNISNYADTWKVILLMLSSHHLLEAEKNKVLQFAKFSNLKSAIDEYYKAAFSPEVVNALEFVENSEIAASIISHHLKVGAKDSESTKAQGTGFQTNLLFIEREIKDAIGSLKLSRNHILFIDGIDIRPSDIKFATYIECIRGLAQAAWSLNTDFFANIRDSPGRIKVVLLLRPDILDTLGYQNLNAKVRDNGIVLDWRTTYQDFKSSRIFQLIDGILGKQQEGSAPSLGKAWRHYFPYSVPNLWVPEKNDDPFISFLRYSFYRPRDVVSYLLLMQSYVNLHPDNKDTFTDHVFKSCQADYSNYLLGEVKDHLAFYYSGADFDEVINFFQYLGGKSRFNWDAFKRAYGDYRDNFQQRGTTLSELNEGPEAFMQFLFTLNIVGFDERVDDADDVFVHWCFRDRTPVTLNPKVRTGLNYDESRAAYFVHPGLARALRVGGGRRSR